MKTCTKCKIAKAKRNFSRKGNSLNAQCKSCDGERKRKWREANSGKVIDDNRKGKADSKTIKEARRQFRLFLRRHKL